MEVFIIPVISIICAVGLPMVFLILISIKTIQAKHEERMAMIAQGMIPEFPEKKANRFTALRNGILLASIGLGALVGPLISRLFLDDWALELYLIIFPILFAGIGYLIYFFIVKRMEKNEPKEKKQEETL